MRHSIAIAMLAAALLAPAAHADTVASVASPDGALKVELDLNGEGRLAYRVSRKGHPLVADSRLHSYVHERLSGQIRRPDGTRAGRPRPPRFTGNLAVTLDDGSIREIGQDHMRGGVDAPLARAEVEAKFAANARHGGVVAPERLLDLCRAILAGRGAAAIGEFAEMESEA